MRLSALTDKPHKRFQQLLAHGVIENRGLQVLEHSLPSLLFRSRERANHAAIIPRTRTHDGELPPGRLPQRGLKSLPESSEARGIEEAEAPAHLHDVSAPQVLQDVAHLPLKVVRGDESLRYPGGEARGHETPGKKAWVRDLRSQGIEVLVEVVARSPFTLIWTSLTCCFFPFLAFSFIR